MAEGLVVIERRLPLSQTESPVDQAPRPANTYAALAHVADDAVVRRRTAVFAALQALGVEPWTNEPLARMAAAPGEAFADEPLEAATAAAPLASGATWSGR